MAANLGRLSVATGFRSHLGGAQAVFGVRADLACYGKVIGGGLPVGVVAGKRAFMDALAGGAWGSPCKVQLD